MSKSKLHKMGYRLGKSRDFYWKCRRNHARPENKTAVQVKLRESGWYDVTAIEAGNVEQSSMLRGIRQLQQWEQFAFCK